MSRTEQLLAALQANGKRITPQRIAICRVLAESKAHPAPYMVYEQVGHEFPGISKATVYNTIALLRDLGELVEMGLGQESRRYEPDLHPHANLICLGCGRVEDLDVPQVAQLSQALAQEHAFQSKAARMDIYGYCHECAAKGR